MDPTEAIADMSTQGTVSIPETTPTTKPKKPSKTKRERELDAAYDLYLYRLAHATASTADDVHRNSPTPDLFAVALAKIHAQCGTIVTRREFTSLAEQS